MHTSTYVLVLVYILTAHYFRWRISTFCLTVILCYTRDHTCANSQTSSTQPHMHIDTMLQQHVATLCSIYMYILQCNWFGEATILRTSYKWKDLQRNSYRRAFLGVNAALSRKICFGVDATIEVALPVFNCLFSFLFFFWYTFVLQMTCWNLLRLSNALIIFLYW